MSTQILQAAGTAIGDFPDLSLPFDTHPSEPRSDCTVSSGRHGYAGKSYSSSYIIDHVVIYGSNDQGYSGSNGTISATLYGKNGAAPTSGIDGTSLGTLTFTDTDNESTGRSITSSSSTPWSYVWVYFFNNSAGSSVILRQVVFFSASQTYSIVASGSSYVLGTKAVNLSKTSGGVTVNRYSLSVETGLYSIVGQDAQISGASVLTYATCSDTSLMDWSFTGSPSNYSSYFITGYKVHGQGQRKFQGNYLVLFSTSSPGASAFVRYRWDYSTDNLGHRFSQTEQVYMSRDSVSISPRRVWLRGQGLTLQIEVFSDEDKSFRIVGYSMFETGNSQL